MRLAQAYTHPRVFATTDGGLPAKMQLPFFVCLVGMALLYVTLWRYEMASKNTSAQLRALRRKLGGDDAVAAHGRSAAPSARDEPVTRHAARQHRLRRGRLPRLPRARSSIYVVIMAAKLARFERELSELDELADERVEERERETVSS